MFEPEVFRKQMNCIEGTTCDIVGTKLRPPQLLGAPIVIRRPGNCSPFAPLFTPLLGGANRIHAMFPRNEPIQAKLALLINMNTACKW